MYKPSSSSNKFDKRIVKRIEQAVHAIHALYGNDLLEIDLFGSYSKGSAKKYSSLDILVVLDKCSDRFVTQQQSAGGR